MWKTIKGLASSVTGRATEVGSAAVNTLPDPGDVFSTLSGVIPPVGRYRLAYHKIFEWLLVDGKYGLVNFTDDADIATLVRDIAALHQKAASGGQVSDDEWAKPQKNAELKLQAMVAENAQMPSLQVIRSATSAATWSKLKEACNALIVIIANSVSQDAASAGASAATVLVPTDIGRRIVFGKVREFLLR